MDYALETSLQIRFRKYPFLLICMFRALAIPPRRFLSDGDLISWDGQNKSQTIRNKLVGTAPKQIFGPINEKEGLAAVLSSQMLALHRTRTGLLAKTMHVVPAAIRTLGSSTPEWPPRAPRLVLLPPSSGNSWRVERQRFT